MPNDVRYRRDAAAVHQMAFWAVMRYRLDNLSLNARLAFDRLSPREPAQMMGG